MILITASTFDEATPYNDSQKLKEMGLALAILGVILFTLGLFLTTSKTNKQRAMDMELSNLRYARDNK